MPSFKWRRACSVYLPEIDAEHRGIYQAADELQRMVLAGAGDSEVQTSLRALTGRVEDHFLHEERQMHALHYPFFVWHKRQHETARSAVARLQPQIEAGDREAALELLQFLAGWLKNHTGVTDRMMAAFLRSHERLQAVAS